MVSRLLRRLPYSFFVEIELNDKRKSFAEKASTASCRQNKICCDSEYFQELITTSRFSLSHRVCSTRDNFVAAEFCFVSSDSFFSFSSFLTVKLLFSILKSSSLRYKKKQKKLT